MKASAHLLLLTMTILLATSCVNDITNMGVNIQPEGDRITVAADTFHLTTANVFVERMYNRPDSLLIGTFIDERYGTTYADILTRFEPPFDAEDFRYPTGAVPDSAFLILAYRSWFGAANSVMSVKAYEMNGNKTLDYYTYYPTNLDITDYCDQQVLLGDTVFAANDSANIRIRLSQEFTQRLFDISANFKNEEDFFNRFKGLYIAPRLGDATMIYLRSVNMRLYYHYTDNVAGRDTTFSNTTTYVVDGAAVNRFQHPDSADIRKTLEADKSINYVASPANIYTQINVPLRKMIAQMQDSVGLDKHLVVNGAMVHVEVKDIDNQTEQSDIATPLPTNLLLMKKDEVDDFFRNENLPNDSVVYATYSSADSCYTFNIARYITHEIQRAPISDNGEIQIPDQAEQLELMLLPVRITQASSSGTTTISSVDQQVLINGVTIRSGQDPERPMKIDLIYSGF